MSNFRSYNYIWAEFYPKLYDRMKIYLQPPIMFYYINLEDEFGREVKELFEPMEMEYRHIFSPNQLFFTFKKCTNTLSVLSL